MYLNLHQRSPIGRPPGKTKLKGNIHHRTPVGLSENLAQTLRKNLYLGLYQYPVTARPVTSLDITPTIDVLGPLNPAISSFPPSSVVVRNVRMLLGESISHIFSPEDGLIPGPLSQGRMLLLTNLRVIAFGQKAAIRETILAPLEQIKLVAVNTGQRSKGALIQGGVMIVIAVMFYVILAYWLTGHIDGPQVPIIRMDLVSLLAFLAVLIGITVLAQMYFAKPDGEVMFKGDGVEFTFSFRGETSEDDIYVLVNAAFDARHRLSATSS